MNMTIYGIGFIIAFVWFYLYFFFKDRGGPIPQNGAYGIMLAVFATVVAMFWPFGAVMMTGYAISQIPRAINWFIDALKKELLPSSFDRWS